MATAEAMYEFFEREAGGETTCDTTTLVAPGDPEGSVLWLRVRPESMDDGPPCVAKMPKGSTGLSEEAAMLVYDWILAGAPR
jgi:hypothetical protein